MESLKSFLNVIKRSISTKAFTREYYQEVIAKWSLNGWLTDPEVVEALAYLDKTIPAPEPETVDE